MHRHGYKGRKFGRERDQRRALMKGLASNLAVYESIETTVPKAKELVPYFEKLITKAKKGDLHNRRQVISKMANLESAHKLVDEIAPKLTARNSGHLRIERTRSRRGDNVELARVSFVDDLKAAPVAKPVKEVKTVAAPKAGAKKTTAKPAAAKKAPAKKPAAKKEAK
jgi:large subunit ribosomal protein L17